MIFKNRVLFTTMDFGQLKEHGPYGLKHCRKLKPGVVAHTFNPSTGRQRQVDLCEFKASLVYLESSRTARTIQRNPVLKPYLQ